MAILTTGHSINNVLRGYIVLCYESKNSIVLSRRNTLYRYLFDTKEIEKIIDLQRNWKFKVSKFSLKLRRMLRSDIRFAIKYDDNHLLAVQMGNFYLINTTDNTIVNVTKLPRGSRPLKMTNISGISGIADGLYFGEYYSNPDQKETYLYKYDIGNLSVVYTYPPGTINHVHNLVVDQKNDCVYHLVGDFGNAASIYRSQSSWDNTSILFQGEQKFRSCVGVIRSDSLLYFTDSQFEQNELRSISTSSLNNESIESVNGPVIYSTNIGDELYFSTAVEAENSGNKFQRLLTRKSGKGIIIDRSELCKLNSNNSTELVYAADKDILPFGLFQFGNILFPSGYNESNKLCFSPIGLKDHDMCTVIINIDK